MSFRIRISYLVEVLPSFSCDRNEAQRRPNCNTSHAIFTMRHYFSHERTMKGYARRSAYKSDLFIQLQIISPKIGGGPGNGNIQRWWSRLNSYLATILTVCARGLIPYFRCGTHHARAHIDTTYTVDVYLHSGALFFII